MDLKKPSESARKRFPYRIIFPALFAAEGIFLFYMALQPGYAVPGFHLPFFMGGDIEHFPAYAAFGFLGHRTFSQRFSPGIASLFRWFSAPCSAHSQKPFRLSSRPG